MNSHPKGLYLLFVTEMSERFSYYGMRALLTLYMVAALFTMTRAAEVYGTFTSLVYLTPLIGGYIADRFWGNRRSILAGGICMAVGQFLMFLSACFIQPSIHAEGGAIDPTKDAAFTIFYMGVNIGALLAPLVCGIFEGSFQDPGRFRWGFLIACIVISLSMVIFSLFKSQFLVTPDGRQIGLAPSRRADIKQQAAAPLTRTDYVHMLVIVILAVFVIFFWAAYEQAGSSLTYFADQQTDKTFFGWEMPTSWFQTFPAFFCVVLAPVMNWLWQKMGRFEPHSIQKLAIGLALLSLAYLVIAFGVKDVTPGIKVSILWIISLYFIQVLGELSLSPIGLSLVSRLSPKRFASLMMGIWYLSTSVSNFAAGKLATLYPEAGQTKYLLGFPITDLHDFFLIFVVMSAVASILLFCLCPLLKRMMK